MVKTEPPVLMARQSQTLYLLQHICRKYVHINNSIEEEIKGRISLGNKAFYANQDLFKSKLLTKNSKLRMYKTLVRPVVTYACETRVLKENIKTKLRVFERKVLRRI